MLFSLLADIPYNKGARGLWMDNLYLEYKPKIDKCFDEIKALIEQYEKMLTRNPRDRYAESKQSQLYFYLTQKKKDLQDMPNRRGEYEYYIDDMNKHIQGAKKGFNDQYSEKVSSKNLSDARKALDKGIADFNASLKEIKDFNTKYKQKGNHTDNYAAIRVMHEIESAMLLYQDDFLKEKQKPSPQYDEFVNRIESATSYYRRLVKATIRDQQYYG